jgi:putative nucleotidyltransferase-like protein
MHSDGRGGLVAAAVVGAWRREPAPPSLSAAELESVAPLLLDGGCGALAWWRIRGTPSLASSHVGEQLREAYRFHTLQAALHARELEQIVGALGAAGVDALVVKGWTAARHYPEPGLRPYGDIDICVSPEQHDTGHAVLAEAGLTTIVDLHRGLAVNSGVARDLPSFEEAWGRSAQAALDGLDVRVLAPEDHLSLLCVHLLTHGAWRPLWLCDIGAALECLPDDFDWSRCLGRTRRLATWVSATVALAERLLGAQPRKPLPSHSPPPRWLERAVLDQWGSPRPEYPTDLVGLPAGAYLRPSTAARVVRAHWVDPIAATMQPGTSFNSLPRLPFQLRFVAWKTGRFLRGLAGRTGARPAA